MNGLCRVLRVAVSAFFAYFFFLFMFILRPLRSLLSCVTDAASCGLSLPHGGFRDELNHKRRENLTTEHRQPKFCSGITDLQIEALHSAGADLQAFLNLRVCRSKRKPAVSVSVEGMSCIWFWIPIKVFISFRRRKFFIIRDLIIISSL